MADLQAGWLAGWLGEAEGAVRCAVRQVLLCVDVLSVAALGLRL